MPNDTKNRILETALRQFSQKGYEATNIRDLSAALGLTKSAFYKHYSGKEALLDAVIAEMDAYYSARFTPDKGQTAAPQDVRQFKETAMEMFRFTVHDEKIVQVRRLLVTEQFHDARIAQLASRHFNGVTVSTFTGIFDGLIKNGALKKTDPEMLAFAFASPVASLVHLCDREPEKIPEAEKKAEEFIDFFLNEYKSE